MTAPADPRGRFFSTSQYSTDSAAFGDTRGFGRLWDTDAAGISKGHELHAGWARGQIIRSSQPAFVLTSLGPPLDPTGPAGWRPEL